MHTSLFYPFCSAGNNGLTSSAVQPGIKKRSFRFKFTVWIWFWQIGFGVVAMFFHRLDFDP